MPAHSQRATDPGSFLTGLTDPWRGLRFLIHHPRLWPWAVIPFAVSLLLYLGVLALLWHVFSGWLEGLLPQEGAGWQALAWVITAIFWIAALWLSALTFVPVAVVVAGPFNDLLSEKTERLHRGVAVDEPFSLRLMVRSLRVGITGSLMRALTLALLLIFALCFNLIPVIGTLTAAALSAFFTARYLSLEFTSYSMDRRLYTWPQQRDYLRRFRGRTLGFGAMAFVIMLVPLLNALFIPISAVAGTILFCDTELAGERTGRDP